MQDREAALSRVQELEAVKLMAPVGTDLGDQDALQAIFI